VLVLFTVRCAPDSPVHLWTEGKNFLPNGAPTAPSFLGAIKGTPRRMEQYTKPPLKILRRLESTNTHSDHRVWDLSTSWVVNSCAVFVCSSLHLCACDYCDSSSCVCLFPSLALVAFVVINIVRVRGSNLWRFLTNGKILLRKKIVVLKVDHWITWEGLSAILDRRRSPQRGVGIGRTTG
jgi:hypothetical protein